MLSPSNEFAGGQRRNSLPPEEILPSGRASPAEGIPIGPSIGLAYRERSSSCAGVIGGTLVPDSPPSADDFERPDSPESTSEAAASPRTAAPPSIFSPLLKALNDLKNAGSVAPFCSNVGEKLCKLAPDVYKTVGVSSFKEYAQWAERDGLVCLIPVGPGVDRISLASTSFI